MKPSLQLLSSIQDGQQLPLVHLVALLHLQFEYALRPAFEIRRRHLQHAIGRLDVTQAADRPGLRNGL
jgi:hypothetical protein